MNDKFRQSIHVDALSPIFPDREGSLGSSGLEKVIYLFVIDLDETAVD